MPKTGWPPNDEVTQSPCADGLSNSDRERSVTVHGFGVRDMREFAQIERPQAKVPSLFCSKFSHFA